MDLFSISWWRGFYSRVGRQFSWGCVLIIAVHLVIGFGWNQFGRSGNERATAQHTVIARVNGEPVTQGQYFNSKQLVQKALANREAQGGAPQDDTLTPGIAMDQ